MQGELHGARWITSRRKRVCDLCLCACVFPVAAVTWLLSVIAIWHNQSGPIFFRQQRIGRHGVPFTIIKLRTMIPGQSHTSPLGELLSVLGADETPQLLHDIWKGVMTTIGPRPLIAQDFATMARVLGPKKYAEWYAAYTLCRPGWMSVFSTPSRTYVPQSREYLMARYAYDTAYIHNACLREDITIFFRSLTMWCTDLSRLSRAIYVAVLRIDS